MKYRKLIISVLMAGMAIQMYSQDLWGWGYSSNGQLNATIGSDVLTPMKVNTDSWKYASCGYAYALGIKQDGTMWGWGYNGDGKLGVGYISTIEPISSNVPQQIGTNNDWKLVSCGTTHSMAIKTNGTLWGWGSGNTYGQIGDGTSTPKYAPIQIGIRNDYKQVATTMKGTFALMDDGTIWSWGMGFYGELGNGFSSNIPQQIGKDNDWAMIKASDYHTLALKKDGTLWGWGDNEVGNLGDGTTTSRSEPTRIGVDNDWAMIACSDLSSFGIKKDGSLWAWGKNDKGQLGIGSTGNQFLPVRVGTETNWYKVFGGNYVALALKKDGTLWAWGNNKYKMVGNGATTDQNVPVQILPSNTYSSIVAGNTTCLAVTGNDPEITSLTSVNMGENGKALPTFYENGFSVKNADKNTRMVLSNIEGKILLEKIMNEGDFVRVDYLSAGVYLIKLQNRQGTTTTKYCKTN